VLDDDDTRHEFSTEIVAMGRDTAITAADAGAAFGFALRAISPFIAVGEADIAKTEFFDDLVAAADLGWLD
jgi:hypothetical protein